MTLGRTGRSRGMTKTRCIGRLNFGGGNIRTSHIHILSLNVRQDQRGKDGGHGGTKFQIEIHYNTIYDLLFHIFGQTHRLQLSKSTAGDERVSLAQKRGLQPLSLRTWSCQLWSEAQGRSLSERDFSARIYFYPASRERMVTATTEFGSHPCR